MNHLLIIKMKNLHKTSKIISVSLWCRYKMAIIDIWDKSTLNFSVEKRKMISVTKKNGLFSLLDFLVPGNIFSWVPTLQGPILALVYLWYKSKSKAGDHSQGQSEGSLFNSYYTKV